MKPKYCPYCGKELPSGNYNYCYHCGHKLTVSEQHDTKKKNASNLQKQVFNLSDKIDEVKEKQLQSLNRNKDKIKKIGIVLILFVLVFAVVHHITYIPKGLSNSSDVMTYCLKRDPVLNTQQKMVGGNHAIENMYGASGAFDDEENDDDRIRLLINKKTGRYVFKYKYDGQTIPCYVIVTMEYDLMTGEDSGNRTLDIVPIKRQHIAGIFKEQVSDGYIDKHFDSKKYMGYSLNDLSDMDIPMEKGIKTKTANSTTHVSYDTNRDF